MKIVLITVLAALVLGGLVGTLLVRDAGYVLVTYGEIVLETSLWVGVLLIIILYFVIRTLAWLFSKTWKSQLQFINWRSGRREKVARSQTTRGLLVMNEGRWAEARKLLLNGAQEADTPLLNYLNAARAAHKMGEVQQRDEFLKRAHAISPSAKFAVSLSQAEFHIDDQHFEQALAALLVLHKRAPKHASVLAMLTTCYEGLGDWQALRELLADVAKHKALPEAEIQRLQTQVWRHLLHQDVPVAKLWKQLPGHLKSETEILLQWIQSLLDRQEPDQAEAALRLILAQTWDQELVRMYGNTRSSDIARQLVVAQGWAKERPNDPTLLLSLGRLCLANEKFAQAREYFEASLRLQPQDETYGELGRLCVAIGDERRGTEYLLRSLGNLPDLPQPQRAAI